MDPDPLSQRCEFKPFTKAANFQKILGIKISSDDELIENTTDAADLTIVTTGEVFVYNDIRKNFRDIRTIKAALLSQGGNQKS